jgi:hypothetical protein
MPRSSSSVNQAKRKVLSDLKFTGLLLSDLGPAVFGDGSETDPWLSGDLSEEFIQLAARAEQ